MRPVLVDWIETEARAKVNLDLRVFPPGKDGYHPLETVFCRIDLSDHIRLRLRPEPGIELRVGGPEPVASGPDNLAFRAAELMLRRRRLASGVEMELEKRIPAGSGLGGGSSDAAAVLRILETKLPPSAAPAPSDGGRDARRSEDLVRLGGELGADVPFFVLDEACALGWGIGDRLLGLPDLEPRPLLLLLPDLRVPTREAYQLWDRENSGRSPAPRESPGRRWRQRLTWRRLGAEGRNDFEPVIFNRYPELGRLHRQLLDTRPILARLSGSGSGLFAAYDSEKERDAALASMRTEAPAVRSVSAVGPA